MPPSRPPRHAAAPRSRRRSAAVPAVLLLSVGASLGGLALFPRGLPAPISLTAAAASAPLVLAQQQMIVLNHRDLSRLDDNAAVAPSREGPRASRDRPPVAPPAEYVRPGVGVLTSGFKFRWGRLHPGIDLAGPYGSPIRAVTAGQIIFAGWESGYGNFVQIRHDDGVVSCYGHMSRILISGGRVTAGEQIGEEGSTGFSTGPHLHFEIRISDVPIDPIPWLASHGIIITGQG